MTLVKRKYYLANRQKILLAKKKYYLKQRTAIRAKQKVHRKIYYRLNKKKEADYQKEFLSNPINRQKRNVKYNLRRKNDPMFRARVNLKTRLYLALKAQGFKKDYSVAKYLGCSIQQFKTYLSSLFQDGMNWGNYGSWHIDHIIPCCFFDLSQENNISKCFHYSNLQPLWAKDNISKGGR